MPNGEPATIETTIAEARTMLRTALAHTVPRLGLTAPALDALVARAEIMTCVADQTIGVPPDAIELVACVIAGAVKVICEGDRGAPVVMQLVPPGRFFRLAAASSASRTGGFRAVAHVPSVVASFGAAVMTDVVSAMPPACALQMMAYGWRGLSSHLFDACRLLTMPLRARLLYQLEALARDFGRPHPSGVVIDLPLTHADLAALAVGTRANVTRAVTALRGAGRLAMAGRRLVVRA